MRDENDKTEPDSAETTPKTYNSISTSFYGY